MLWRRMFAFTLSRFQQFRPTICMRGIILAIIKEMPRDVKTSANGQLIIGFPFGRLPNTCCQLYEEAKDTASGMCSTRLSHWGKEKIGNIDNLSLGKQRSIFLCITNELARDDTRKYMAQYRGDINVPNSLVLLPYVQTPCGAWSCKAYFYHIALTRSTAPKRMEIETNWSTMEFGGGGGCIIFSPCFVRTKHRYQQINLYIIAWRSYSSLYTSYDRIMII